MGLSQTPQALVGATLGGITSANSAITTQQSTTSTSYTDLATTGPSVTLTTGTKALVLIACQSSNGSTVERNISYAVSGASTISAGDSTAITVQGAANDTVRVAIFDYVTLTAGSNTFTMKYKVNANTGYFLNREICVIDLGS